MTLNVEGCFEMGEHSDTVLTDRIKAKLQSAFAPATIEVSDQSHRHAGHAHVMSGSGRAAQLAGTHFNIKIVSDAFKGKSRIERHRAINDILRSEFAAGVHAVAIEAKAPGE
jgi:BolA family transcriptional regulator, general stress-responsive regulator